MFEVQVKSITEPNPCQAQQLGTASNNDAVPFVVSYGVGVDSTAMLVGLHERGIVPNAILTSIPGSEKDGTMDYIPLINRWLDSVGFPRVIYVRYVQRRFIYNPSSTIVGQCLANRTMPSISFGRKSCSSKWKGDVLDNWVSKTFGKRPCYRAIGFDCGKRDTRRFAIASSKGARKRPMDEFGYPLQAWGWNRERCKHEIVRAGLPVPPKSSCCICGAMKKPELETLTEVELMTCVIVEANASINNRSVVGLGRNWRFSDEIVKRGLLDASIVEYAWDIFDRKDNPVTDNRDMSGEHILGIWLQRLIDWQEDVF